MTLTPKQAQEILNRVAWEGNPRLFVPPISDTSQVPLPLPIWQELLTSEKPEKIVKDLLWRDAEDFLPRSVAALDKNLQSVGLLLTDSTEPSLVYAFTQDNDLLAWRGFVPFIAPNFGNAALSVNLGTCYRIHNGWIDLFSYDNGWMPLDKWRVLGASGSGFRDGFLEVFRAGSNAMGFDLSTNPAESYMITSDDEVEPIDDFWGRLDSWLSRQLRKMDPRVD